MPDKKQELLEALNDTLDYAEKQMVLYKGSEEGLRELERLREMTSKPFQDVDLYQALSDTIVLIDRAPSSGWCEMEMALTNDYRYTLLQHIADHSLELAKETCKKIHGGEYRQRLVMETLAPLYRHPELAAREGQLDSLERALGNMTQFIVPEAIPHFSAPSYNPMKITVTHRGAGEGAHSVIDYDGTTLAGLDNPIRGGDREKSDLQLLMHARIVINGGDGYFNTGLNDAHLREVAGLVNELYVTALEDESVRAPDADIGDLKRAIQHFDFRFNEFVDRPEMFPGKFRDVDANSVPYEPWVDTYEEPQSQL